MTFEQFVVPLNLNIEQEKNLIPDIIRTIPVKNGQCNSPELSIEVHLSQDDLMIKQASFKSSWDGINKMLGATDIPKSKYPSQCTVASVKEDEILKAIRALADLVYKREFKETIKAIAYYGNLEDKFYQVVEIPWSLLDLYPGDTEIHFKIFTKRELKVNDI